MYRILRILPLLALLAGCAVSPPTPTGPQRIPGDRLARQAFDSGDYLTAAREYLHLAAQSAPAQRPTLNLRAAEAYLRANRIGEAETLLQGLDRARLSGADAISYQFLTARIALRHNAPDEALQQLAADLAPTGQADYQVQRHNLRARAYSQLGNHLEAAREYVQAEPFLKDETVIVANQEATWEALSKLSAPALRMLQTSPPPDVLSGWMELTYIGKQFRQPMADVRQLLDNWRRAYPNHPAREALIDSLVQRTQETVSTSSRIALLLPLSGRFAQAGKAVRDGFLAAYYAGGNHDGSDVRVYDVGDSPARVPSAYDQAVKEGAEAVVGPLSKEGVAALLQHGQFPVATLTLNYGDDTVPVQNLYEFALSPEDEATQVADHAWLAGYSKAAVIVPQGDWGQRVEKAFRDRLTRFGGQVVTETFFDPTQSDFTGPLTGMLNIDQSAARRNAVTATIGQRVKFTPRRRQDLDFIFLAALPREARLIRPQLKFFHAAHLPVLSTSSIFSGTVKPELDQDMDGIVFTDMPWTLGGPTADPTLHDAVGKYLPYTGGIQRLVALGVDAYRLLPMLKVLSNYPHERLDGVTGSLRVDENHRVRRQLLWARLSDGRPELIAPDSTEGADNPDTATAPPASPPPPPAPR